MKLYRILLIAALGALALTACKDDEETTTSKTLDGTLSAGKMDAYSNPGDTYTFTCSGVSLPSDEEDQTLEIVYYFKDGDYADTTTTFTFIVPDTLGTYSITATAKAEGYYTKTATLSTVVISERSLTGTGLEEKDPDFTDTRDNKKYNTVAAGGKTWFARNLAYFEKDADNNYTLGHPYADSRATEDIVGGFYTWTDAQAACPAGWHLPTAEEFDALGTDAGALMCNGRFNGALMWEFWPEVKITNATGFSALPYGYATIVDGAYTFYGTNDYAYFWVDNAGAPMCRSIYVKDADIKAWGSPSPTDFAANVRCVK
ncbi:MAG: hypothetical protein IKS71_07575 [Bacteroidales bacterium]|nr:hypothetical protein [Bacteroidales bacterium]